MPGAEWRDPEKLTEWSSELRAADEVIVYCVHGHHVSRTACERLRERGVQARIMAGGITAWCEHMRNKQPSA